MARSKRVDVGLARLQRLCETLERNPRCASWTQKSDYYTACFAESFAELRGVPLDSRPLVDIKLCARVILYWARLRDDFSDKHPMSSEALLAVAEAGVQYVRGWLATLTRDQGFVYLFDRLIRTSITAHRQRCAGLLTDPCAGGEMSMFLGITPTALCYLTGEVKGVQPWLRVVRHTMNGIQLADDLLDWEEDLKAGIITSVTRGLSRHGRPFATRLIYLTQVSHKELTAAMKLASELGAESWKEACRMWRTTLASYITPA